MVTPEPLGLAKMTCIMTLELGLVVLLLLLAAAVRPWRALSQFGPPWAWLAWLAVMPLFWGADRLAHIPLLQPLSGACLLALMAGWPLAMLALVPVAVITTWAGGLEWAEGVSRLLWLGMLPASLAFGVGLVIRRWLPHHLFIYILGRGFLGSLLAMTVAGVLSMLLMGLPAGISTEDMLIGRWLAAWGDAFLTGMFAAIFVAFHPEWLATYSDRLYLPAD
jgi:uncharacterized membrane protein